MHQTHHLPVTFHSFRRCKLERTHLKEKPQTAYERQSLTRAYVIGEAVKRVHREAGSSHPAWPWVILSKTHNFPWWSLLPDCVSCPKPRVTVVCGKTACWFIVYGFAIYIILWSSNIDGVNTFLGLFPVLINTLMWRWSMKILPTWSIQHSHGHLCGSVITWCRENAP